MAILQWLSKKYKIEGTYSQNGFDDDQKILNVDPSSQPSS